MSKVRTSLILEDKKEGSKTNKSPLTRGDLGVCIRFANIVIQ